MINAICGALIRANISTCNKSIPKDNTNNIIDKLGSNFKNNTELTIILDILVIALGRSTYWRHMEEMSHSHGRPQGGGQGGALAPPGKSKFEKITWKIQKNTFFSHFCTPWKFFYTFAPPSKNDYTFAPPLHFFLRTPMIIREKYSIQNIN